MNRRIACFNVPDLDIAVARLSEPRLRGWPTAVAPNGVRSPILWRASAEARQHGVMPGMPLAYAQRLCPQLTVIPPDSRRIGQAHRLLLELFRQFSPVHEVANLNEFYIDLTEGARRFSDAAAIAARIQTETARRHGLKGAMGVSINKLVAHVAAETSDCPLQTVGPGEEKSFLAPFPLTSLPGLTGLLAPKTNELLAALEELCLILIGHFAPVSVDQLRYILGPKAGLLKQWTLGIDPSPVWPRSDAPLIDRWVRLETATVDDEVLLASIYKIIERVCAQLRRHNRSATRVGLVVQYSDGREATKTTRFQPAACWEADIYPELAKRFLSIARRVGVRGVGVLAETVPAPLEQLDFFREEKPERMKTLAAAVDRIRARHGDQAGFQGAATAE